MTNASVQHLINQVQDALSNIHRSLDSAMQFHRIKRHEQVEEQSFVRTLARRSPEEHDQRAKACAKNREVIEQCQRQMTDLLTQANTGEEEEDTLSRALIKALKDAYEKGQWQQGLFFRSIGEQIQQLEQNCKEQLLEKPAPVEEPEALTGFAAEYAATEADEVLVYVSLYQSDGNVLQKWEVIVNTLHDHVAGRPVYQNETDIKSFIRSKKDQMNEGYVVLGVSSKALLDQDPFNPLQDKEGRPLVQVKKAAVSSNAIRRFVHMGESYILRDGQLVHLG